VLGFIGKVFSSKPKSEVSEAKPAEEQVKAPKPVKQKRVKAPTATDPYFLESDAAMTFGDLEYMRSVKSVRRTFAKQKVGADNASVRSLSSIALEKLKAEGKLPSASQSSSSSASQSAAPASGSDRRRADSSMDTFRNMARDIRKG
jgi:hypothetical protein